LVPVGTFVPDLLCPGSNSKNRTVEEGDFIEWVLMPPNLLFMEYEATFWFSAAGQIRYFSSIYGDKAVFQVFAGGKQPS